MNLFEPSASMLDNVRGDRVRARRTESLSVERYNASQARNAFFLFPFLFMTSKEEPIRFVRGGHVNLRRR